MLPYLHLFGLTIPMYGLMLAAAFLLCGFLSWHRARKRGLLGENLIIIAAFVFLFAMIGGGLLYDLVTYSPEQILAFIRAGEWTYLLKGGIVFYGGLIGGVIGGFVGSKVAKDDLRNYLDVVVPVLPLGHAIGRIGCFCAGCCYGRPTLGSIGICYAHPISDAPTDVSLLPVQLMESCANLVIFVLLMLVSRKTRSRYLTTFLYGILYGVTRFVLEFFRYDSIRGTAGGLSTSQWVSIGLVAGSVLGAVMYRLNRKSRSDPAKV